MKNENMKNLLSFAQFEQHPDYRHGEADHAKQTYPAEECVPPGRFAFHFSHNLLGYVLCLYHLVGHGDAHGVGGGLVEGIGAVSVSQTPAYDLAQDSVATDEGVYRVAVDDGVGAVLDLVERICAH